MKARGIQRFIQGTLAATVVSLTIFICVTANAAHEHIYGLEYGGLTVFDFYSDAPQNVLNAFAINGLQTGESIQGIDYWNGRIYGLGSSSRLYTIDLNTGAATQVGSGQFIPLLDGVTFGVDNDPSGLRVVSRGLQNLLISRTTGGVLSSGPNLGPYSPRLDALAYDYASGLWYAGETLADTFGTFNPASGVYTSSGLGGNDYAGYNGLDISPFTGIMYLGSPATEHDLGASLYIVDKLTGFATLVGQIGSPGESVFVKGLTVVPEPTTGIMIVLGLACVGLIRRRS